VEEAVLSDGGRLVTDVFWPGGDCSSGGIPEGQRLVADGEVPVNGRLETGVRGIFAAATSRRSDRRSGDKRRVEHWGVAERMDSTPHAPCWAAATLLRSLRSSGRDSSTLSVQYVGFASRFDRIAYRGVVEEGKFSSRATIKAAP